MKPVILFRTSRETEGEALAAARHFDVTESRVNLDTRLVIGRYSVLPFYHELQADLSYQNSRLINATYEHAFVANFEYYHGMKADTAETWFQLSDVPKDSGPWVIKGRTNSRKFDWKTHMYATTWEELVELYVKLSKDHLLGPQGLVIRKFMALELVEEGLTQPMYNEWRFFFYMGQYLSHGYYWVSGEKRGEMDEAGMNFAQRIATQVGPQCPFVVIDIARKVDGSWVVIELNDDQMSGLSANDADVLYFNLSRALAQDGFK